MALNTTPPENERREFQIELDQYRGPIDLLFYLVKRNELEPEQIPLARIVQQFIEYIDSSEAIDIDWVGDFLEFAGLLVEAKVRNVLPRHDLEEADTDQDPREDLVNRLLMYKQFRDASDLLAEQGRLWQERFVRVRDDLPPRQVDPADQPIQDVELWDLVSAFGRMLKRQQPDPTEGIIYDDTPITSYMHRIHAMIRKEGRVGFSTLFEPGMHKSAMVGVFLAVLELVRHHGVFTEQSTDHGEIWINKGSTFRDQLEISEDDVSFQG